MKSRVIICGYPKSGNTWLTRLTAEIINCPVVGFWCEPFNKEEAIEGSDRESNYECFKGHHSIEQLKHTLNVYGNGTEKIIYIYRDPRAVVLSAYHYFSWVKPEYPNVLNIMSMLPRGSKYYYKYLHKSSYRFEVITQGFICGTKELAWLDTPWAEHVKGFINLPNILCISYEMLKKDPLLVAKDISDFLSCNKTDYELQHAIDEQSFEKKKKRFREGGQGAKASFLRRGESEAWKRELPEKYIRYVEQNLGAFMTELGYPLSHL
ncbi:MAG: sulfotransferase domain-containing protein [Leptolyngbya sp. SIOISBB]|nr:sulfotransferase domain-containing protein [Leptolyngbya sp. SIOISBB]